MLSGAVKADEKCAVKAKPAWDKPFTGEIPEKLPEGYNILLVVTDQERFFPTFPFPGTRQRAAHENGGDIL